MCEEGIAPALRQRLPWSTPSALAGEGRPAGGDLDVLQDLIKGPNP